MTGSAMWPVGAGWLFWVSAQVDRYQQQEDRIASVKREILRYNPQRYRTQRLDLEAKIPRLERTIALQKRRIARIEEEAARHRLLWFENSRLTILLESVLRKSLDLDLRIDEIRKRSVTLPDPHGKSALKFLLEKRIDIVGAGSFVPVLQLTAFVESSNLLLKVRRLTLEEPQGAKAGAPRFTLTLDIYGVAKR